MQASHCYLESAFCIPDSRLRGYTTSYSVRRDSLWESEPHIKNRHPCEEEKSQKKLLQRSCVQEPSQIPDNTDNDNCDTDTNHDKTRIEWLHHHLNYGVLQGSGYHNRYDNPQHHPQPHPGDSFQVYLFRRIRLRRMYQACQYPD